MLDKRYALKLTLTQNTQLVRMEAGLLRRLSKLNPCFPHFYQFGTIEGLPYFVMDLLGLSLGDVQLRMPDEKFMTKTVVRVGLQILDVTFFVRLNYLSLIFRPLRLFTRVSLSIETLNQVYCIQLFKLQKFKEIWLLGSTILVKFTCLILVCHVVLFRRVMTIGWISDRNGLKRHSEELTIIAVYNNTNLRTLADETIYGNFLGYVYFNQLVFRSFMYTLIEFVTGNICFLLFIFN